MARRGVGEAFADDFNQPRVLVDHEPPLDGRLISLSDPTRPPFERLAVFVQSRPFSNGLV